MGKSFFILAFFSLILAGQVSAQAPSETEALFKLKCSICHTIGKGKLIGPDLNNVHQRRPEDWLLNFVRSSQKMIQSGDATAVALFEEHNKVVMPDPLISDAEITSILSYIGENSGAAVSAGPVASIIGDATPEDLENGQNLFEGRVRLTNGGPACISCHNDLSTAFFSENSYSVKDISQSFTNLGEAGVRAILENPPFPVMKQAFEGKLLEQQEVHDLLVFLKNSTPKSTAQAQTGLPSGFLLYGVMGAGALVLLISGFWYSRKNRSVNHGIYKRQIKSFN
ncbi:MAG: cytochrome c [Bacteroidetes bacterium]|nr:cytochrome c [Bacteroidota bacterium]